MRSIILPYDGLMGFQELLDHMLKDFNDPIMADMVAYLKFNDAMHFADSSATNTMKYVQTFLFNKAPQTEIFLDLKLPDTHGTNFNILHHHIAAGVIPGIVTVRDSVSAVGLVVLRKMLPKTVKLALVSALTDMPEEEVRRRYGCFPALKIIK